MKTKQLVASLPKGTICRTNEYGPWMLTDQTNKDGAIRSVDLDTGDLVWLYPDTKVTVCEWSNKVQGVQ